jgi:integrase
MNLFQRKPGGNYYLRSEREGKEVYQSLKTPNKVLAQTRAKAILAALDAGKFDAVMQTRTRSDLAKLEEIEAAYKKAAQLRSLKPSTVRDNLASLRRVVGVEARSEDWDGLRVSVLSRDLVKAFVDGRMPEDAAPDELMAWKRTMRTTLRMARSVFSKWALEEYEAQGLKLPDLKAFMQTEGVSSKGVAKKYVRPPEELVQATLRAARELKAERPQLYAVFLLVYPLALRASEAANARPEWIQERGGAWEINVPVDGRFMTKSAQHRVIPCHEEVAKGLLAMAASHQSGYILPGSSRSRLMLVGRVFAAWMRDLGWTRPKCAHELRALQGCRWFTERGCEVAQQLLGHRSVSTTCAHYAHYSKPIEALTPDW